MNRSMTMAFAILMAAAAIGCGGDKKQAPQTSGDAAAEAKADPMVELQGLSASLQGSVDALMQPITDTDALINEITALPQTLNLDAASVMSMFSAQLSSDGQIEVSADITTDEAVKAEIQALLARLKAIVDGLKAIPQNVQAVGVAAGAALVKVPALGAAVTASANVKLANPFGKAEDKAKAQADLQAVAGIQAGIQAQIQDIQAKVMGIPELATGALAKMAAAFVAPEPAKKGKGKKK